MKRAGKHKPCVTKKTTSVHVSFPVYIFFIEGQVFHKPGITWKTNLVLFFSVVLLLRLSLQAQFFLSQNNIFFVGHGRNHLKTCFTPSSLNQLYYEM